MLIMMIKPNKQKTPYQFQVMKELYMYFYNTLDCYEEFIYFWWDIKLIVIQSITEHMFEYESITNELHIEKYELLNEKLQQQNYQWWFTKKLMKILLREIYF